MAEHPSPDATKTATTGLAPGQARCPICWAGFTPTGRQRYCTDTCRKTAWTRRRANRGPAPAKPTAPQRPPRPDPTIYACPQCRTRYHEQQRCQRCNQPCTRIGLGGPCPHCGTPIAISELLDPHSEQR
jgi:hypothetical protein